MPDIQDYLREVAQLFAEMDGAYEAMAQRLGFVCHGCQDNCCRSLFFHHTLVEFFWLHAGLAELDHAQRDGIHSRAVAVAAFEVTGHPAEDKRRPMCPLNNDERCMLYAYRPMICRLHGIPHELRPPNGRNQVGPGCDAYYQLMDRPDPKAFRLDRTPWYKALAELEQRLRGLMGFNAKIKMTIAQMILQEPQDIEISYRG